MTNNRNILVMAILLTWTTVSSTQDANREKVAVNPTAREEAALWQAIADGDVAKAKALLGKTPTIINVAGGITPLEAAIQSKNEAMVKLLLEHKADLKGNRGGMPLFWAIFTRTPKVVKLLLDHHADVNAKLVGDYEGGVTPLHCAAREGEKDIVELLLARGAKVNAKANYGVTPLHEAARRGSKDVVQLLLAKGADVHAKAVEGSTPLCFAVGSGSNGVVRLLLDHKADVNVKVEDGGSPLTMAAHAGNVELVEWLLAKGADVDVKDKDGAALHVAVLKGNVPFAKLLLSHKADVNAKAYFGSTPLHIATFTGNIEMARLLLGHKADVNVKDELNLTALHMAVLTRSMIAKPPGEEDDIFPRLFFSGWFMLAYAKIAKDCHVSIPENRTELVRLLLAHKADVNAKADFGFTPLHWAVCSGNKELVQMLLV